MVPSFFLTNCSPTPTIDVDDIKIYGPEKKEIVIQCYSSEETTIVFGFSYENVCDTKRLSVTNTFSEGLASFESTIINVNEEKKTFDIRIISQNATPGQISGNFEFFYEGIKLENSPKDNFTLSIVGAPKIEMDGELTQNINLDSSGTGSCVFSGFRALNVLDHNSFKCVPTFAQDGATVVSNIDFVDNEEFTITIQFSNARSETLKGGFLFYQNDTRIFDAPSENLSVVLVEQRSIVFASKTNYDVVLDGDGKAKLLLTSFYFSSLDKDKLSVVINSQRQTEISPVIVNWNEKSSTFDVEISLNCISILDLNFSIVFLYDDGEIEPVPFLCDPFTLSVIGTIPEGALKILQDSSDVYKLSGIQEGWIQRLRSQKYGILKIPSYVSTITSGAFENLFNKEDFRWLKTLEIPLECDLETIEDNAFYGCDSFESDLILPYNISKIGESSFENCHFKSLTFTNQRKKITIGSSAFAGGSNFTGDLIMPTDADVAKNSFSNCTFDGTLVLPLVINDDFGFENLIYLKTIDFTRYIELPSWYQRNYSFLGTGKLQTSQKLFLYTEEFADDEVGKAPIMLRDDMYNEEHNLSKEFKLKMV